MAKYLGEFSVNLADTEFKDYKRSDWAMYYISNYGQSYRPEHRRWVLDQIARIFLGVKVNIMESRWADGHIEYSVSCDKPTKRYNAWVKRMKIDEDGDERLYDMGMAP